MTHNLNGKKCINQRSGGSRCRSLRRTERRTAALKTLPSEFDCLKILAVDLMDYSSVPPFRFVEAYRPPDYASRPSYRSTRALSTGSASFQDAPLLQTCGLNSWI
jgi:hypothetical protein